MKKVLFCLLSGILFAFSSCQSEEPNTNPNSGTTSSTGKAVKFSYDGASPTVKTYYDNDGNVRWSHEDKVVITSPVSDVLDDEHHSGVYTIGMNGGQASGDFIHHEESETQPVYWNKSNKQHFHAYYPSEMVGRNLSEQLGAITDIDPLTGAANFHVPANQSAILGLVPTPSAPSHKAHPLSYAVAATKGVTVNETSPVALEFHDFMNVLRIHINNPTDQPIKGIKLSTTAAGTLQDLYVAGTTRVTPPHASVSNGTPTQFLALDIDNEIAYEEENDFATTTLKSVPPTPLSREITVESSEVSRDLDLYYDLFLLPQDYPLATLQITVMMGEDNSSENDIVKVVKYNLAKSSIKKLRIDIPRGTTDRVYMGIIDGRDTYVAIGNLIAEYYSTPTPGTPPDNYYIAGTDPEKSLYVANDDYDGSNYFSKNEIDLFKAGLIDDPNYWTLNSIDPSMSDYTSDGDHTHDPKYDLISRISNGHWYTPTLAQMADIWDKSKYAIIEGLTDYKGYEGLNGMIISTIPDVTPGVAADAPSYSFFLPYTGLWNTAYNTIHGRGENGIPIHWSSTHYMSTGQLFVATNVDITEKIRFIRAAGFALRPVSNYPTPASVDFSGNSGEGWLIKKEDDGTGHIEEPLY